MKVSGTRIWSGGLWPSQLQPSDQQYDDGKFIQKSPDTCPETCSCSCSVHIGCAKTYWYTATHPINALNTERTVHTQPVDLWERSITGGLMVPPLICCATRQRWLITQSSWTPAMPYSHTPKMKCFNPLWALNTKSNNALHARWLHRQIRRKHYKRMLPVQK